MQDGRSLVSLTHDSLAAAHLLTSTDVFLKKSELQQLQMLCLSVSKTPAPAVVKSMDFQGSLWTGKQLFSMLLPSGMNFSCDRKLHIIDSEVLTCSSGSSWLQILLDPINIPVLKCLDETEDVTLRQSDYIQNNLSVVRSSIMAFKDVFSDLLKMVQQQVSNDNSMMVMINAGSKGSMLKYAQQTACVGLQLPASKFPFRIPSQLSCTSWNMQKSLNCEAEGTNGRVGGQNLYAVIRHSFIEGLNPLECLLHAISGRANFFSEHADVPGTLTRKLMYHLRDLHVAYDGTVRSSYGQHITQFSYDTADDMYCNRDRIDEIGAPVGSWAASSVSEAAYGALDHPVNGLEDSPLMNLQVTFFYLFVNVYTYRVATALCNFFP